MILVDVTEYIRPNGRRMQQIAEVDDVYKPNYDLLCSHGLNLSAELLRNGIVSLTIESDDDDLNIELCSVRPDEIKKALEKLLAWCTEENIQNYYKSIAEEDYV